MLGNSSGIFIKTATVPYWRSALAGVDPTGYYTYRVGKEERNRHRDVPHMSLGALAGGLSGLMLIPSLTGAGVHLARNLPKTFDMEGLKAVGSRLYEGAAFPYTGVYRGWNTSRQLDKALESNTIENPRETAESIRQILGVNHPMVEKAVNALPSAPATANIQQLMQHPAIPGEFREGLGSLNEGARETVSTVRDMVKHRTQEAMAALGASAALGSGSALLHYHMGRNAGQELRGEKNMIKVASGIFVKEAVSPFRITVPGKANTTSAKPSPVMDKAHLFKNYGIHGTGEFIDRVRGGHVEGITLPGMKGGKS